MPSLIFQVHLQSQHLVKGTSKHPLPLCQEAPPSLWVLPVVLSLSPARSRGWLGPGLLRAWLRRGTSRRRSLPAPCRTPPAQSRPLVTSCGQCWDRKKNASNQDWHTQTQPRVLENVQRVYSHGPFRLQAQQAFSDQQKFGSEIWDALDSNHEVSDDL